MALSCRWCPLQFTQQRNLTRHEKKSYDVEFQHDLKGGVLPLSFGVCVVCCLCVSTDPDARAQHEATPSHVALVSVHEEVQTHLLIPASSEGPFSPEQEEEHDFGDLGGGEGGGGGDCDGGGSRLEYSGSSSDQLRAISKYGEREEAQAAVGRTVLLGLTSSTGPKNAPEL